MVSSNPNVPNLYEENIDGMSDHYKLQTAIMFKNICKEDVLIDEIQGVIYCYASELATLRLFAKYNNNGKSHNKKAMVGIDRNGSHYFSLNLTV